MVGSMMNELRHYCSTSKLLWSLLRTSAESAWNFPELSRELPQSNPGIYRRVTCGMSRDSCAEVLKICLAIYKATC
ncbi:hypothetical protein Y032_0371g138 [Ancylostoma ceylanicum]|uniref:Uncharacterized protein n=1 Tax=Ancylostoma ceylanicum TaxID=53326 RepID=A0A016RUF0_9BILA|nr:hypothetical protein Y032_0371g138 [Ancylostoma ceylanicum]